MASVKFVGRFADTLGHQGQRRLGSVFQRDGQGLFLAGGKRGEHPGCQVEIRVGLGAYADLDPGELLTSQLGNDGFDTVVASGRAVAPDPQPPGV